MPSPVVIRAVQVEGVAVLSDRTRWRAAEIESIRDGLRRCSSLPVYLITHDGGAAPSTPCLDPSPLCSPDCVEFGESGVKWLSLEGVELFLPPSPDCVEFGESGLKWLSLEGVELFLPPLVRIALSSANQD
ncbi:hypothetical protein AgCh_027810 [Apium graveolens]